MPHDNYIVEPARLAMSVRNRIREIVDQLPLDKLRKDMEFISLGVGDPTKYPNLKPSPNTTLSVIKALESQNYNGYGPSFGLDVAREAIAKKYSYNNIQLEPLDVFLGSGCSDAILMTMSSILNPHENILLPKPGFSLYQTISDRNDYNTKYYKCVPDNGWQIDLKHLESLVDSRTRAILINSPSNPCGSVLSRDNLIGVLKIASKYKLVIISDEIYNGMTWSKEPYTPIAQLLCDDLDVPCIVLGGLAKQYLVPGWRVGWLMIYDLHRNKLNKIRDALLKVSTLILGPNTLIQASLPNIINNTPKEFYITLLKNLKESADLFYKIYNNIIGLKPIYPSGAMYMLTKIELNKLGIKNDIEFSKQLLLQENVLVLPGEIFGAPGYFRTVICPPPKIIKEVGIRINRFCQKLYDNNNNKIKSNL